MQAAIRARLARCRLIPGAPMLLRLALVLLLVPTLAGAAPWRIDPGTEVAVEVPWRGGKALVHFPPPSGSIDFDADHPERARAVIVVATAPATTGLGPVDALLHGADYLDSARFPQITFRLDQLVQLSPQLAEITGRITLRGVTRPVTFAAGVIRYGPATDDPGRFEAGFDLTGSLDRTEFGSTGGVPEIGTVLPIHIRLLMSSQ